MNMAKYCKEKGMNLEQYKNFSSNIEKAGAAIIELTESKYRTGTGMYHETIDILSFVPGQTDPIINEFMIQELKKQGMEFIENNKYWRL